jgi:bifunctional non-homologous end joining protein LigD
MIELAVGTEVRRLSRARRDSQRTCRLISRNNVICKRFDPLCAELARVVRKDSVLDGVIVCLDPEGRPQFYELLRGRGAPCFVAFDVLKVGDEDLRGLDGLTLTDRKAVLEKLVPDRGRLLRAKCIEGRGVDFFRLVCEHYLEGIVAKHKRGAYIDGHDGPVRRGDTSWFKIKNPTYSQSDGRHELFAKRAAAAR